MLRLEIENNDESAQESPARTAWERIIKDFQIEVAAWGIEHPPEEKPEEENPYC